MSNEFLHRYGYRQDRESRLREVANGREDSLSMEAANQIRHLKAALRELVLQVETYGNGYVGYVKPLLDSIDEANVALNGGFEE